MWIKICGITTLEDAQHAIAAGADAVGFVFAASPRRVMPEAVREIIRSLPSPVEKIGVFVNASVEEIIDTCEVAGLSGMQLQGEYPNSDISKMCERFGKFSKSVRIVQVVSCDGDSASLARQLQSLTARPAGDDDRSAVLVDTRLGDKVGGTGVPFDWGAAQDAFLRQAADLRLIVAGGLQPENVRQAIQTLHPWGVDVCSGVERVPGRKDHLRVKEFIRAARAAAVEFAVVAQR